MKVGFLILCHTDPVHIGRLARRLADTEQFYVLIHVDRKAEETVFRREIPESSQIRWIEEREDCKWGRMGTVRAELKLLEAGVGAGCDRLVLLQGLDYPLKSNEEILAFFREHPETEYLRACRISDSQDEYHYRRCRRYWMLNNSLPARLWNRLNDYHPFYIRSGCYRERKTSYPCYWGSAQWALTADCGAFILNFVKEHPGFVRYYSHIFPCDETFFASILYNSAYMERTATGGPEPEERYLVNWRNLHYFEYPKQIRIFREEDYEFLKRRPELFVRKVCTGQSDGLLHMLDEKAGWRDGRQTASDMRRTAGAHIKKGEESS